MNCIPSGCLNPTFMWWLGGGKREKTNPNKLPTNLIMMKGLHVIGCPAMISTKALHPQHLETNFTI